MYITRKSQKEWLSLQKGSLIFAVLLIIFNIWIKSSDDGTTHESFWCKYWITILCSIWIILVFPLYLFWKNYKNKGGTDEYREKYQKIDDFTPDK